MLATNPVTSALRHWFRRLLVVLPLAGCAALPVYNPILPPLPAASLQVDEIARCRMGPSFRSADWLPEGQPRAVMLALHGFNDSRDAWEMPGPEFAKAGIAVFAPDQRGFGAAPDRGRWAGSQT